MITALLNPALIIFVCGILLGSIFKSITPPTFISKYLGYYLLLGLGLKGGYSLQQTGFINDVINVLSLGVFFALLVPITSYLYLKRILNADDAAALSGTYGSVSAVTFVTANTYLLASSQNYENYMSAVLVVMEFPAIFMALYLVTQNDSQQSKSKIQTLKTAFLEIPNIVLLSSLIFAYNFKFNNLELLNLFTKNIFDIVLIVFLFIMGLSVSKRMSELSGKGSQLISFALITPVTGSLIALIFSSYFGLSVGNATLLMVLTASASYIAVPAVVKDAIPNANPAIYLGLSLGVTFPFNVIIGIPLYNQLAIYFLN
ncbi:sodium-dependent bicarbonate transport family permease [Acidimicrobiia bacterium]|nr:sodium-dependent bicarbonate transport family permease [Acidimicrobiia bacterium]